jgi:hypothetical protein
MAEQADRWMEFRAFISIFDRSGPQGSGLTGYADDLTPAVGIAATPSPG